MAESLAYEIGYASFWILLIAGGAIVFGLLERRSRNAKKAKLEKT